MMDLIILTTAICRPDVHMRTFPPLIKALELSTKIERVYHFINIDYVVGDFEITPSETQKYFELMFQNSTKIERIYSYGMSPCFLKAVKRLAREVDNLFDTRYSVIGDPDGSASEWEGSGDPDGKGNFRKVGVLLFEDDWLARKPIDFDLILEKFNDNTYILLSDKKPASRIAYQFHPSLWSRSLFKAIYIKSILETHEILDPERIVKSGSKKLYTDGFRHSFYQFQIFKDIGRKWIKKTKLEKWDKKMKSPLKITY